MRVLVTGGSGFIGSHVVDKLRAHGHEPVIYDLRRSPWHENGSVEIVIGSVTDRAALGRAMADCDAVAHLAAVADVNDVHAEPEDAERVNARGTAAVLEAARRAGVDRVVYASTIWVYSDTESVEVDEDTLLPPPSHLYTSTKLAGELYCRSYQELYGIDYTILRFGIPYGPRAREAAVIPAFVNKALAGEPLTLSGDGLQSRRFVYVEDLAEGVALGLSEVARNRVYNLTSNEDITIKQIAETVQQLVGNTEIVYKPARPGDFGSKIVASERAHEELGWTASTPFHEGVRRYVDWRREQSAARELEDAPPLAPAGELEVEACPRKILIVSADIGEGHDLPARQIAREFKEEDPEVQVSVVNGLPAMGSWMTRSAARAVGVHVPVGAVAVRLPVSVVHEVQADAVARALPPDLVRRPRADASDQVARPRADRLHLSRRDRDPRRTAPSREAADPLLLVDHRPRGPAVLGASGDRPALHHPSRVERGGRADRRTGQRPLGAAAGLAGVPEATRQG